MLAFFGPGGVGIWELLIILFVIVLLFGAKRIPELARGLGAGVNEFKKGLQGPAEEPKQPAAKTPESTDKPA